MMKYSNTTQKADLRRKNSISDEIRYTGIDIQVCMVIFAVAVILLLLIFSVAMTPNPNVI